MNTSEEKFTLTLNKEEILLLSSALDSLRSKHARNVRKNSMQEDERAQFFLIQGESNVQAIDSLKKKLPLENKCFHIIDPK